MLCNVVIGNGRNKNSLVDYNVVAPTLIAVDTQAGKMIALGAPLLPEATMVAMSTERRFAISEAT